MRQALWILRKDVRRLWPALAVYWLLMAAAAVVSSQITRSYWAGTTWFVWIPIGFIPYFLVILAVHEDSLVGDRRFCLTRPYSRKSLLLAKCLFVLMVVNLTGLLVSVTALAANGLSMLHYFPQILLIQVRSAASMLIIVALAALTANLVQLLLAVVAGYAGFIVLVSLVGRIGAVFVPRGGVAAIDGACQTALGTVLFALACWRQFGKRDRQWASGLFVCGAAVVIPVLYLLPWTVAFRLAAWQAPPVDPSAVRLAPDSWYRPLVQPFSAANGKVSVRLPIELTGIPDGMEVYSERVKIELRAADGSTWNSGWNPDSEILDQSLAVDARYRLLPGKGPPYWLRADVDRSFCNDHPADPVHVHATVAFTMLGRPEITEVTYWNSPQPVGSDAYCDFSRVPGFVNATCFTPLRRPALSIIRLQPPTEEFDSIFLEGQPQSIAVSGGLGIWSVFRSVGVAAPEGVPFRTYFETRQIVGHFERELDVSGVHLTEAR